MRTNQQSPLWSPQGRFESFFRHSETSKSRHNATLHFAWAESRRASVGSHWRSGILPRCVTGFTLAMVQGAAASVGMAAEVTVLSTDVAEQELLGLQGTEIIRGIHTATPLDGISRTPSAREPNSYFRNSGVHLAELSHWMTGNAVSLRVC